MDTFLPSDFHYMVYFVTTWEMHGFSHQNPLCDLSGCFSTVLFFLLVPKSIDSLKNIKNREGKLRFLKKEKPIPGTLELKAKYIKRRRENGCNFIKNKEYKYVLGKSMSPYTNLSLFLIIISKNYISHPKILMKCAATVVFVRKVSQGSSFKKVNSTQTFPLACDVVVVLLHKRFSFICQTAIILKDKTQFLLFHPRKIIIILIIILNLFFCGEYVNLDYIHWT